MVSDDIFFAGQCLDQVGYEEFVGHAAFMRGRELSTLVVIL